jgi:hypothetical protein
VQQQPHTSSARLLLPRSLTKARPGPVCLFSPCHSSLPHQRTCALAEMHMPSIVRDRLMERASVALSPTLLDFLSRSLPAKSTMYSLPTVTWGQGVAQRISPLSQRSPKMHLKRMTGRVNGNTERVLSFTTVHHHLQLPDASTGRPWWFNPRSAPHTFWVTTPSWSGASACARSSSVRYLRLCHATPASTRTCT